MNMRLALVFVIALAACGAQKQWVRDGASPEDFYRDSGECKAQALAIPGAPMMQIAMVYGSCMQGKGWRRE